MLYHNEGNCLIMRESKPKHKRLEKATHRPWTDFYGKAKADNKFVKKYGHSPYDMYNMDMTIAAYIWEHLDMFENESIVDLDAVKVVIHTRTWYDESTDDNADNKPLFEDKTLREAIDIVKAQCLQYIVKGGENNFTDIERYANFEYGMHVLADIIPLLWE